MSSLPNNAKAVIALTSWKARINTVGQTIFSILVHCPHFHIVLTLCTEEFPKGYSELPLDIQKLVTTGLIEILWTQRNVRSFKKWLVAANKYPNFPIITADDDCLYTCNYAEKLYQAYLLHDKTTIITNNGMQYGSYYITRGPNTLFPPHWYKGNINALLERVANINACNDDAFYTIYNFIHKYNVIDLHQPAFYVQHTSVEALSANGYNMDKAINEAYSIMYTRPVISCDCMIGHLHKEYDMKYTHPFFWCVIPPIDLITLMSLWDTINFNNIAVADSNILDDPYKEYQLIIDSKVHIHYIHIKESLNDKSPRKVQHTKYGGDIYYCNPSQLIIDQFNRRRKEMAKFKTSPVFLIEENPAFGYTKDILKFFALHATKQLYIITSHKLDHNDQVHILPIKQQIDNDFSSGRTLRNILAVRTILFRELTTIN